MPRNFFSHVWFFLLSLLLCAACDEDDINELSLLTDVELIVAQDPSEADIVNIEVKLSHPEVVADIAFYVDDQHIADQPTFPFTTVWDTEGFEDGTYTIKAVITTRQGEEKTASKSHELSKSLLKLTIEEAYFQDFVLESWILLSDTNGNQIGYVNISNGMTVNIERPAGFTDQQFHVTAVRIEDLGDGPVASVDTYLYQKKDEWLYDAEILHPVTAVGSADFKVINIPSTGRYTIHVPPGGGFSSNFFNISTLEISTRLYENPSDIYFSVTGNEGTGKYTTLEEAYVDETYNLDYLAMVDLSFKTIELPENETYLSILRGIENPEDPYTNFVALHGWYETEPNNHVTLGYPQGLFDYYMNFIFLRTNAYTYSENLIGDIPDRVQIPEHSTEITMADNKDFHYSASGPFDFVMISSEDPTRAITWDIYGPMGADNHVKLPTLPGPIIEKYAHINDFEVALQGLGLNEHFEIQGYDEYLTKLFKLDDGNDYWPNEYRVLTIPVEGSTNSGGRLTGLYSTIPHEMREYMKAHPFDF